MIQPAELVERHYRLVYRYTYRLSGSSADADDLTQQTFLTAIGKLAQLREPQRAAGWLCRIARNIFLKSLRPSFNTSVPIDSLPEPAEPTNPDLEVDSEELQRILMEMPEEFRSAIILFYFQEFSYRDIAEHLDVPIGTVMSRLSRGKAHLRRQLMTLTTA